MGGDGAVQATLEAKREPEATTLLRSGSEPASPTAIESALGVPDRSGASEPPRLARVMPLGLPLVVRPASRPGERNCRKYVSHLSHSLVVVADDKTVGTLDRDSTGRSPSFSNLAREPARRSLTSCFSEGLESWTESVAW